MLSTIKMFLFTVVIGAAVSLTPLSAQTDTSNPNATNPNVTPTYVEHRGGNWGWLGLFGLLGLLGLRRGGTYTTTTRDYGTNRR